VRRRAALLLLTGATLAACTRTPAPPAPQARYLVGEPYQMGGVWSYPREDFGLVETGLASVAADQRAGRRTANGEVHDPTALVAAHRTLQLPAILRVTNLETGLELDVRLNDRGPSNAGRVVELSRRAAELLGIRPGGAAQIRVAVVTEASRALAAGLPNPEAPRLEVAAAPLGAVQREDLAPPPGASQASRLREARPMPRAAGGGAVEVAAAPSGVPDRIPERVARTAAAPGRLYLETASFSRRDLADRQAARIGGRVEAIGPRGRQTFRVRIGPLNSVAEADRALEATLRAGVSEARILVD
jgi:rare lipoprotein A